MSDCFFCDSALPAAVPDELDDDERLAFDPHRGRLWQICPACGRWNLTPIESRWEVLERCDELTRDARALLETEHLALVACGDGQLIRVGVPARRELADWRYSSRLDVYGGMSGRVRRALLALPESPVGGYNYHGTIRPVPEVWLGSPFLEDGALLATLFGHVPLAESCPSCMRPLFIHPATFGDLRLERGQPGASVLAPCALCGDDVLIALRDARPALRAALALVSRRHREPLHIERAVGPLDRMGGAHRMVQRLCASRIAIGELRRPARLALWIALDELAEAEALEAEWRAAEALARIADGELTEIPGFDEFRERIIADQLPLS